MPSGTSGAEISKHVSAFPGFESLIPGLKVMHANHTASKLAKFRSQFNGEFIARPHDVNEHHTSRPQDRLSCYYTHRSLITRLDQVSTIQ